MPVRLDALSFPALKDGACRTPGQREGNREEKREDVILTQKASQSLLHRNTGTQEHRNTGTQEHNLITAGHFAAESTVLANNAKRSTGPHTFSTPAIYFFYAMTTEICFFMRSNIQLHPYAPLSDQVPAHGERDRRPNHLSGLAREVTRVTNGPAPATLVSLAAKVVSPTLSDSFCHALADGTPSTQEPDCATLLLCNNLCREQGFPTANKQGASLLHHAVASGTMEYLRQFARQHQPDSNMRDNENRTPLHLAAEQGNSAVVLYLIDCLGTDPDIPGPNNMTPLHLAAGMGYHRSVTALVSRQASLELEDESGNTPLILALYSSSQDHRTTARKLLKAGAKPEVQDANWSRPLHIAASQGAADVVSDLLDRGANVNAENEVGLTPLHCAVTSGSLETVQCLLAASNIDVNTRSTAYAQTSPLQQAASAGHAAIVHHLLKKDSSAINETDSLGQTPLHEAAHQGCQTTVKHLLAWGADVNARTHDGKTPLHEAVLAGAIDAIDAIDTVKQLVEKGADPDARELLENKTPLDLARETGQEVLVQFLTALETTAEQDGGGKHRFSPATQ